MTEIMLSPGEISTLCLELSLFFEAGADPATALSLLASETEDNGDKKLAEALKEASASVDSGMPLSDALASCSLIPADATAMLKIGEKTGRTEETLRALSDYYRAKDASDRNIRGALLYPSILMLVMLAVVALLLVKVLPIFGDVYASLGAEMTGAAGLLLRIGLAFDRIMPLILVILIPLVVFMILFSSSYRLRGRVTRFIERKMNTRLIKKQRIARFAEAMSLAISSGFSPTEAVLASVSILPEGSPEAGRAAECAELLDSGMTLSEAVKKTGLLPASECRLLSLGIAGGNSETVMREVAKRLSGDAEEALAAAVGMLEPILVIISSLLVGIILLSVMLPLTQIMTAIG